MAKIKITVSLTELKSVAGGEVSQSFELHSDKDEKESETLAEYYGMVTQLVALGALQKAGE